MQKVKIYWRTHTQPWPWHRSRCKKRSFDQGVEKHAFYCGTTKSNRRLV